MIKEIAIKPGYKKTPVGIIPEDWEVKELDSLFTFKNGLNADRTRYGKGVKFINVMEVIYSDSISPQDIPGTIEISEAQKKLYKVEYGDIVFNRTSETPEEVGLSAVYLGTEEVVFGGFVIRAKPRNKAINTLFKKYGFRSSPVRRQIIQRGQGAVRSNIGQKDLATVKIILPPPPEQKAIADCLSTWDRGIDKLTALVDAKKEQKKGLMQRLLTGSLRLRSATGEPFDGEWKEVRLGDIAYITTGASNKQDASDDFEYVFFDRSSDVLTSKIFLYDCEAIIVPGEGADFIPKYFIGKFDLHQRAYAIMNFKNVLGKYIFYYLMNDRKHLLRQAVGSTVKSLRLPYFKSMPMKIPSIEEQTAIAEVLMTADREIELLEQKLEAMKEQKKGLMQVLLTGEKRLGVKN